MIELRHAPPGGAPVVFVELKRDCPDDLGRLLAATAGGGVDLVVDLGDRSDASSDLLVVLHRAARHVVRLGGTLGVVSSQPDVRRLFDLTLLTSSFPVFASRDEALAARSG